MAGDGSTENSRAEDRLILLPGFRFHPTDEELITSYLLPRILDEYFIALAVKEADLRKLEPWELPWLAKMGEEEWYFYCLKERRYPTGNRTNRGTKAGYWKATGKDKAIYSGNSLVGMKKTLVFYRGRAPKGVKSSWVMHEFRLEGKYSKDNLPASAQSDCVISRVFHKTPSGKKTHISALPAPIDTPEFANSLPRLVPYAPPSIGGVDGESSIPTPPENDPPSPFDLPSFADYLQFSDSSMPAFLFDDPGDGNDLVGSLKAEAWTDPGPGGGGGYVAGVGGDD